MSGLNLDSYFTETGEWAASAIESGVTETFVHVKPSEWAEQKRIIPKQLSVQPGPYSFDSTPYLREILD